MIVLSVKTLLFAMFNSGESQAEASKQGKCDGL